MLSAKYRFHSRGGVNFTYRHGRAVRSPLISLIYTPNTRKKTRFAVVVSKKVLKSAVGRNHIRRRVYEVIRLRLPELKTPTDHIFIIHNKEISTIKSTELTKLIYDLLHQAKLV